ncbi:MAG TPA: toll/interleukin-1 receptor domain-containing protein, partial [Chthoniobacterales bacterium]
MVPAESNPSELRAARYWCFISYRHADNKEAGRQWATWLHQAIETYEVPDDLAGSKNERGDTIPERIFPVFRDEEELPADADLSSPIYRALDASRFLLAICSPRAVGSAYVAEEILYFKKSG